MTARANPILLHSEAQAKAYAEMVATAYLAAPVYVASEVWRWKLLAKHVETMFERIQRGQNGVRVEFVDGQPYKSSKQLRAEVARTRVLQISREGNSHPVFTPTQNLKFRAVHDYITHVSREQKFSIRGEIAAYNTHRLLCPVDARPAFFTEVVGQASVAIMRRFYPEQKIALLPFDYERVGAEVAPKTNPTPRRTSTASRSIGSSPKLALAHEHFNLPALRGSAVPETILLRIADTFGVSLRVDDFKSGVFGNVYPATPDTDVVVKVTVDYIEAGTGEWLRRKQHEAARTEDAVRVRSCTRVLFPNIHDVIALRGPATSAFLDTVVRRGESHDGILYATLREETRTSASHARAIGADGGEVDLSVRRVFRDVLSARAADLAGVVASMTESRIDSEIERAAVAVDRAIVELEKGLPDLPRSHWLALRRAAETVISMWGHGLFVTDLHGENIRWRYLPQPTGWPPSPCPLISDFGMGAFTGSVEVPEVAANPSRRRARRAAIASPRIVRC